MAIASPGFKASETGFAICPGGGLKIIPSVIKDDRWALKRHAAQILYQLGRISGGAQLLRLKLARSPAIIMSQS